MRPCPAHGILADDSIADDPESTPSARDDDRVALDRPPAVAAHLWAQAGGSHPGYAATGRSAPYVCGGRPRGRAASVCRVEARRPLTAPTPHLQIARAVTGAERRCSRQRAKASRPGSVLERSARPAQEPIPPARSPLTSTRCDLPRAARRDPTHTGHLQQSLHRTGRYAVQHLPAPRGTRDDADAAVRRETGDQSGQGSRSAVRGAARSMTAMDISTRETTFATAPSAIPRAT